MRHVVMILVSILALKLLVVWLEPRIAFYPMRGVQETPAAAGLAYVDVAITTEDGETLHAWWLEHPQPRAQAVYFHGNGGNLSLWLDVFVDLRRRGFSVLAVDYRGYGASSGSPTETGLYRDTDAAIRTFDSRLRKPTAPVIYWGRSIGAPFAAYAATKSPPAALVLEAPISSLRDVLRTNPVLWLLSFFSSYRFSASTFVRQADVPLLVIHGDRDSIVPHAAGRRVFDDARTGRKTFVTIDGADHNDLHVANPTAYWRAIDAFVADVGPRE